MKIAILGASKIAHKVVDAIRVVNGFELAGVASASPARLADFSNKFKIPALGTYMECLDRSDIGAVYISVLNSDHYRVTKEALLAGKHVLCEKPLVLRYIEAAELFNLAESKNLILLEGFMYRFHPQVIALKSLIDSGQIGQLKSINLSFSFNLETQGTKRRTLDGGGGAISDLGCYCIDFANWVCGLKEISKLSVQYDKESTEKNSVDDYCIVKYKAGNNINVVIECSISQASINCWEVRGVKGAISVLRFNPQSEWCLPVWSLDEDSEIKWKGSELGVKSLDQFVSEFENFNRAILKLEPPFVSPECSLLNAHVIEMVRNRIYPC